MKFISTLALTLLFASCAAAQEKHTPTIDESLSLRRLDYARISPDGKLVAYGVRQTNWKDNEYSSQIWIADVATGKSYQLTRGKKSAGQPEWSPDGHWLAFVTAREAAAIEPLAPAKKEDKKEEKKDEKVDQGKGSEGGGKPAESQLWLISAAGGEAWQITKSETDIEGFAWSKDSKHIAFTDRKSVV